ncbi:uncharacterized protein LOC111137879 isoform X2 [Crassostrea virginica]
MDNFVSLILLLSITSLISEKLDSLIEPKCFNQNFQNKRCCTDFRTIRGKCQECVGSFGPECTKPCPEGYYGKRCSEKCQCNLCNGISGECENVTTEALNSSGEASERGVSLLILFGLCASIGSLAILVMLLYIRERKKETTRDTIQTALNMEENRLGMCELEDYDNIRESRMDFTVEKQTVDRISYARTYNKLSLNSCKNHAMAYISNNLYNVSCNTASQTAAQSSGDFVIFASNLKSPNCSESEHTQKF